jgi:hypothetical protein
MQWNKYGVVDGFLAEFTVPGREYLRGRANLVEKIRNDEEGPTTTLSTGVMSPPSLRMTRLTP